MKQKTALSLKHLPTTIKKNCLKSTISLELIISTDMFLWLPTLNLKCWFALISSSMNESNTIKCKRILSYIIQILLIRNCMNESNIIKCKSILSYISQLLLVSNSMKENIIIRCKSILRYIIPILSYSIVITLKMTNSCWNLESVVPMYVNTISVIICTIMSI